MSKVSEQLYSLIQETLNQAEICGVPEDEAFYLLGNTLSSMGEFEQALKAYSIAIKSNNRKPEYHHNQVSTLKRKIHQEICQKIDFLRIEEKDYVEGYRKNWGSYPRGFISEYSTEADKKKKILVAVKGRYLDVIGMYLVICKFFPNYEKVHLTLASTYIEIEEFQKAVESYQNFIQIYEEGKFVFNPIVCGSNQKISGSSELKTIILTSINYLKLSEKNSCIKAFRQAYSLHVEKKFWYNYAENGRASVINREEFEPFLGWINVGIKIPENLPNDIKEKILSEWHKDKLNSIEGQFWQIYSQGGYELVRTQDKFKDYLEFINIEKWNIYIPYYLPDEIRQKILSNWKKEKLNSSEGQFWQIYSQGGYELVRTQDKFKDYLEFINIEKWIYIPDYIPNEIQQKILSNWKKEKLNSSEGQFWQI